MQNQKLIDNEFIDTVKGIFHKCKKLIGADVGYVGLINPKGATLKEVIYCDVGSLNFPDSLHEKCQNSSTLYGLGYQVMTTGEAKFINDFNSTSWAKFLPEEHPDFDNILITPMSIKGQVIGVIALGNKADGFTPQDLQLATVFGEMTATAFINRDMSKALRDREIQFSSVAETATDAIIIINKTGQIIFWNSAAKTIFGYSKSETLGQPVTMIIPERLREKHHKALGEFLITGSSNIVGKTVEITGVNKSGKEFPIEISLSQWENEEGLFFTGIIRDISQRKSMEYQLQRSEQYYKSLFDNNNEAIYAVDLEGNFISANQACTQVSGYSLEELLKSNFIPLTIPDDREKARLHFEKASKGEVQNFELSILHKRGHAICLEINSIPIFIDGQIIGLYGITKDITEKREAEAALKASQERFKSAFDYAPIGMTMVSIEGKCLKVNEAFCKIVGYSEAELMVMNIQDISYPEDLNLQSQYIKQILAGEINTCQMEKRYFHKAGKMVWTSLNISLIRDSKGEPLYFIGQTQDVTEHKKAQEALVRSRDFYHKLLDEFPTLIWRSTTEDAKCTYVNKSWLKFTGCTMAEELGDGWTKGLHPEDFENCFKVFNGAFKERKPFEMELRLRRHDGEYRWMYNTARPFYDFYGDFAGYLGSCYDITDRKKIEEEVLKSTKIEAIGTLAGGLAHDFNNYLAIILGNISLSKMKFKDHQEIVGKLIEMEKAAQEAKGLTQQLLTFAKGGAPVRNTIFIGELVKDAFTFALSGSNISYEIEIVDNLWSTAVDEAQINQVLNNLIINSKQAMPNGGKIMAKVENLTLTSARSNKYTTLSSGKYVQISIKDEGVGIEEDNLAKVFDPYFTTKKEGSGLGLATSYSIIKKHDGIITVDSKQGEGTCFNIILPASLSKKMAIKEEEKDVIGGKGKILVLDDEEKIREVVAEMLEYLGYEVALAHDGAEAIKLFQEAKEAGTGFDALIMDLTIRGGMGGKEAVKRILQIDYRAKAIVSSGYSDDPVMARYKSYGFEGCVAKPYKIEELDKILNKILNTNKIERAVT